MTDKKLHTEADRANARDLFAPAFWRSFAALSLVLSVSSFMNVSVFPFFDGVFTYARDISITANAAVLIAIGLLATFRPALLHVRALNAGALVLMAAGCALPLALGLGSASLLVLTSCALAVGRAWCVLTAGIAASRLSSAQAGVLVPLAFVVQGATSAFAWLLPVWVGMAIFLAAPFAAWALSWRDARPVLEQAQAGEAPDIAEISSNALGTYVEMGVAIDIAQYMAADRLADYDENALKYLTLEGTTYGLPLYLTIQSIGANKTMMEGLGIDVAKIQKEGWTYEEFLDVIKQGTKDGCYGFVFANSGVTASDMLYIFGAGAGLSNTFTPELKYTFTSENMLTLLSAIEEMTKSGYMPNFGVEAGQRMVMCQTGNAMIFGKAMPLFENNFKKNNAALEANDGTAVENSQKMDYAFLPVPTMDGCEESCYGTVDGLIAMRNKNTTDEHLKNVLLFMDYICSGERIATCMNELYLDPVCQSGRDALVLEEGRDADNLANMGPSPIIAVAFPLAIIANHAAARHDDLGTASDGYSARRYRIKVPLINLVASENRRAAAGGLHLGVIDDDRPSCELARARRTDAISGIGAIGRFAIA